MSGVKFNNNEQCNIDIIKCLLELLEPWRKLIKEPNEICGFTIDELKDNVVLVEKMIEKSNLDEEEMNIINDTLINKKDSMERIGRRYFYSDSGLRNKVNLILKKIMDNNF